MSDTPETDEARMKGYGEFGGDWSPLERNCYEKHPEGDVVFCEVARKLERERDEARRERDEAVAKLELAKAKVLIMEDSLKWIAGRYCYELTTTHLALVAYEMSSQARWVLQEMEQKEEAK